VNAVLMKDLLQTLRLKRVAAVQILWLMVLGAAVLEYWPQRGFVSIADSADDGLLFSLILGQVVLLILFVPGIAAVAIASEREANTLEMLSASLLSRWQIIFGKAIGALFFPLLLLISGLPFAGLLLLRGAISLDRLILSYAVLLETGIMLSALALSVSAFCHRASTALVISYSLVAALCGVSLVPAAILLDSSGGQVAAMLHYARALSPASAILAILRPSPGDFDGRVHGFISLGSVFLVAGSVLTIVCVALVAGKLTRPMSESEGRTVTTKSAPSIWRRLLLGARKHKHRKPIAIFNPLLVNESRINLLRSGRWIMRIFYGCLVMAMALMLISLYGGTEDAGLLNYVTRIVVGLQIAVIALVAPGMTSATISSEIEMDTFELLRVTPLGPGQIFFGKLIPAFSCTLLPIIALLPLYGAICFLDPGYWPSLLRLLPVLILAAVFGCTVGLMCSAFAAHTARATVASYLISGTTLLAPVLIAWIAQRQLSPSLVAWLSMPSPLAVSLSLVNRSMTAEASPSIWSAHLWTMAGIIVLMLLLARFRLGFLLRRA
jgi:ABC-type transport system involved in multi-copper enzyme maturation permease subunit